MLSRGILAVVAGAGGAPVMAEAPPASRARSGDIAIQEELEAARKAGTVEAYDLFIARHPNHPLAQAAHSERDRLSGERPHEQAVGKKTDDDPLRSAPAPDR
jgi:hypothetical protein